MDLNEFYREIESDQFQSRFMIFSGFRLVRNALSRDPTVKRLINEARLNPALTHAIAERILALFSEHIDDVGATFDVAVAAYLFCLYTTNQDYANTMSGYILEMGKLWWSVDLALRIRKNMELFAEPNNRNFNFSGNTLAMDDILWSPTVVQRVNYQKIRVKINGKEPCDISGQFSVKSHQKTSSLTHSVSLA